MSKIISKKEYDAKRLPNPARRKDALFCFIILFLPVVNFCIFNLMQYVTMFRLAFTPTTPGAGIFDNFARFFKKFSTETNMFTAIKNSAFFYLLGWVTLLPSLFTSYYIYRKFPGSKFFQLMLMLPGIVAGMVWVLVYKYFMDLVLPEWMGWPVGLLTNGDTKFLSLVIYSLWFSLGGGLLIYTGMMGSVSEEVRDAGRLDGMNRLQEFFRLMLPAIYPVWVINTVSGVIGFFSATGSAFEFFGLDAPSQTYTIGYVMFQSVMNTQDYAFNSAGSLVFTAIVAPLALGLKRLLEKIGPSED